MRVLVVGDVALDVLVTPANEPVPGADVPARIRTRPGGAGANTAAWLAHLGADATLAARVGDDPAGRAAVADLAAAGVSAHLTVDPEATTCTVVALLGPATRTPPRPPTRADASPPRTGLHPLGRTPGIGPNSAAEPAPDIATHRSTPPDAARSPSEAQGSDPIEAARPTSDLGLVGVADRTLLSDRGAAARLAPADLPAVVGFDHLHLSGYVLLDASSRAAGQAALAAARAAGLTTSVDPQAAPALAGGAAADFLADVDGVDLLLPNADELRALGGEAAVLRRVGAVATSAGAVGASWAAGSGRWRAPAPPVAVVDPTGAGDAFDAGVLVAWLGGADPQAALVAGCAAGTAAVGRLGARP